MHYRFDKKGTILLFKLVFKREWDLRCAHNADCHFSTWCCQGEYWAGWSL